MTDVPIPGQKYVHFKGGRYEVDSVRDPADIAEMWVVFKDGTAARLTDPPAIIEPLVVYNSLTHPDGPVWARQVSIWTAPATGGGVRFQIEN